MHFIKPNNEKKPLYMPPPSQLLLLHRFRLERWHPLIKGECRVL